MDSCALHRAMQGMGVMFVNTESLEDGYPLTFSHRIYRPWEIRASDFFPGFANLRCLLSSGAVMQSSHSQVG